jgi:uncharacterized protein (DUF2062 family)
MMFRRRQPLSRLNRIRAYVWPRSGLRRSWRYNVRRLQRIEDSSYSIAAGLACGVAVAFTPFVGLHFVLAALIAWLIGGNIIASALGTLVGNPWTFPLFFLWTYQLGHWLLGGAAVRHLPDDITLRYLIDHPMRLLLPMALGSIPTALAAWAVTFFPTRILIERAQKLRRSRIREGAARNQPSRKTS